MLARVESFLRGLLALSRLLESLLVDVVSALTPWLAPLVPAWLVWYNLTGLGIPSWVAVSSAIAVECLGLSSINTALSLWKYNDERGERDRAAPFGIALLAGVFYVAVVVTVNTILDIDANGATVKTLAYALLSLLSVVAGIIIAVRAQHARRLSDISAKREEIRERRRELREARRSAGHDRATPPVARNDPVVRVERKRQRLEVLEAMRSDPGMGSEEVLRMFPGVPRRTIYNWIEKERKVGQET